MSTLFVNAGDEEEEAAANEDTLAADQLAERNAIEEEADGEGNNNDDDGEEYDDGEEEGCNVNGEDDDDANGEDDGDAGEEEGEGAENVQEPEKPVKKKSEPYEVPKSGHFYLHDDRTEVKDRGEGEDEEKDNRPRKKLWSDEPKWKHDKYVEVSVSCHSLAPLSPRLLFSPSLKTCGSKIGMPSLSSLD